MKSQYYILLKFVDDKVFSYSLAVVIVFQSQSKIAHDVDCILNQLCADVNPAFIERYISDTAGLMKLLFRRD